MPFPKRPKCPRCNGTGVIKSTGAGDNKGTKTCPKCNGTGHK